MLGSGFQLLQHPKKDATTFAMTSPAPCVHPTNSVVVSFLVGFGGRLMSLERLVDCVQLLEGVKYITEISNVPWRGLHNSRRYQIFHGGGQIIHGGIKHSTEGVK